MSDINHRHSTTSHSDQGLNSVDDNSTAPSAIDMQELDDEEPSQLHHTSTVFGSFPQESRPSPSTPLWSFHPVPMVPAGITSFAGDPSRLTTLRVIPWHASLPPMESTSCGPEAVTRDEKVTPTFALTSASRSVTGVDLAAGASAFNFDMGGMEQDPPLDVDAPVNHPHLRTPARISLLLSPLEEVLPPPPDEDFTVESHANFRRGHDVADVAFGGYGGMSAQVALSLPPYYAPPSHDLKPVSLANLPSFASQFFNSRVLGPRKFEITSNVDDSEVCHGLPSIVEAYLAAEDGQDGREASLDSPTQVLGKRLHEVTDPDQDPYDDGSDSEGSIYTASFLARDLSTPSPRKRFKAGVQDKENDEPKMQARSSRSVMSMHGGQQRNLEAREALRKLNPFFLDEIQQQDSQGTSAVEELYDLKPNSRPVAYAVRAQGAPRVIDAKRKGHNLASSRAFNLRRWKNHGKADRHRAIMRGYCKVRRYICYGCVKSFPCEDTLLGHIKDSDKQGCRDARCLESTNFVDFKQHEIWVESCAVLEGEDEGEDEDEDGDEDQDN